ncbi:CBS domain-containing protein [Acidiphilium acidophilum]|uniref:CBS domain-containing protein n=1 Tax=Acidiphilium acidophilum TaxID=76588 RepID=UPI002E8E77C0|nr:CBS domain-containing protein [Acidiphilium acidophilum]
MDIKEIMTVAPTTVGPETTIAHAGRVMLDRHLSALPVIDRDGRLLGIVTDGDLLRRPELDTAPEIGWWRGFLTPETSARAFVRTRGRHVGEIMTESVVTVAETTRLVDAVAVMEERRIKQLPVVNDGLLVGLLSRRDILAALLDRLIVANDGAMTDEAIATMIRTAIARSNWAPRGTVTVRVVAGVASLGGTVFSEAERNALRVLAENTAGVRSVHDDLALIDPIAGVAYGLG